MILRAAFALGLVWLMAPHHPDLGLPNDPCRACVAAAPGGLDRAAILQRLREVRAELESANMTQPIPLASSGREAALQNAGRPPEFPVSRPDAVGAVVPR